MNRMTIVVMAGLLVPGAAFAQSSANVQAGASAQSQTSVDTHGSKGGASVSGNSAASAQTKGSAQAGKESVALSDGTSMNAVLKGSLDAKKSKVGDRVEAETAQDVKQDGKVVLRKGTRLVGHVTEVQAREKGQATSQVGVTFEQAELRDGRQMPLHASIEALAAAQSSVQASTAGDDDLFAGGGASAGGGGAVRGGGVVGGALQTTSSTVSNVGAGVGNTASGAASGTVHAATHSADAVGGLNANGALTSNSRGVFGLDGMSLNAAGSSATQGSVIVSNTRNVHLDSGTQMVLRVAGETH